MSIKKNFVFVLAILWLTLATVPLTTTAQFLPSPYTQEDEAEEAEETRADSSMFQRADAFSFMDGSFLKGAATLVRKVLDDRGSVQLAMTMSELDTNASYSAWYIIFNTPCEGGPGNCTEPEIDGVANAGGFVTGDDGTGYFYGELDEGPLSAGIAGLGAGLADSMASEIHIVLQSHGDTVAGSVAGQISIPEFACTPVCEDQVAVIFPPGSP
jgi:hypothetical protein